MKKLYTIIVLTLIVMKVKSQTGVTSYTIPSQYNIGNKTCLKVDASGNKWFGTMMHGVIKFDGVNYTPFDTLNSGIPDNRIIALAFDNFNNLWVATKFGLTKYDGTNWTTYNTGNSNITNDTINCIYTQGSIIWIGTKNGVGKLQGTNWTTYNSINSGLSTRNVNCLAIDLNNDLYVGTNVGLYRKSGTTWTNLATVSQYYNERMNVKSIYVDANNTKYIGGSGVFILSGNQFLNMSYQYPNSTSVQYGNGNILIKGPRGGVMFNNNSEAYSGLVYRYSGVNIGSFLANDNAGLIWGVDNFHIYSFNYLNYTVTNPLVYDSSPNYAYLDVNQVNAEILNRGDMFWDVYGSTNARYEVPKGSNKSAQFAASLWVGGIDNGGLLHSAAQTYRQSGNDYWPGPIDTVSGTSDSMTSVSFDRVWKLNKINITEFRSQFALGNVQNGTYAVDSNIITYPAIGTGNFMHNLSPFVDVNNDGLYRPLLDGDYPLIKGDQEIYWIFNDTLSSHTETGQIPLGIEVHASAYAFACPNITDSLDVLNYTTFYNYKIFNRSTNNYHQTFIGFWDDADMGDYSDDYVACNPSKNYGMIFNGDAVDGTGQPTAYGIKPPMNSSVILNGPPAEPNDSIDNNNNGITDEPNEKNLMTSFMYYYNDFSAVMGNPTGDDYYQFSRAEWKNGQHMTYGGNGTTGTIPYNFMFDAPLNDTIGWSETSSNNVPADRRFLMGCGPFNLNAGQMVEFDMAQVFTRDTLSAYTIGNLYEKNRDDVRRVQQWFAVDSFPSCLDLFTGIHSIGNQQSTINIYPNPSSGLFTITSNSAIKKIEVFNLLGEVIYQSFVNNKQSTIDISQLSKGIYFVEAIATDSQIIRKKIIIQ